jgi:hypothetical protein
LQDQRDSQLMGFDALIITRKTEDRLMCLMDHLLDSRSYCDDFNRFHREESLAREDHIFIQSGVIHGGRESRAIVIVCGTIIVYRDC